MSGFRVKHILLSVLCAVFLPVLPTHGTEGNEDRWPVVCSVQGANLVAVDQPLTMDVERAGEAWILLDEPEPGFAVLRMPDCEIVRSSAGYFGPNPMSAKVGENMRQMTSGLSDGEMFFDWGKESAWVLGGTVAPGGIAFFERYNPDKKSTTYLYVNGHGAEPVEVRVLADRWDELLIISPDGRRIAWMHRKETTGERSCSNEMISEIRVQAIATGKLTKIPLDASLGTPSLVSFDGANGFVLAHNSMSPNPEGGYTPDEQDIFGVNGKGNVSWEPIRLPIKVMTVGYFRWLDDGWVAWDSSAHSFDSETGNETDPDVIAWSLPSGAGSFELPKGSELNSVTVDPAGRLIALSLGPNYQSRPSDETLGIRILSTKDGSEIYRIPAEQQSFSMNHPRIAFLGSDFLAISQGGEIDVMFLADQ